MLEEDAEGRSCGLHVVSDNRLGPPNASEHVFPEFDAR